MYNYKIIYWFNGKIVESFLFYSQKEVYEFLNKNRLSFLVAIDYKNKKIIL